MHFIFFIFSDMAPQKEIFNLVIEHFNSEQEDMRAAAAFAAGECNSV